MLLFIIVDVMSSRVLAEDWLPVSGDDLSMRKEAKAPGAPAIFLFRQIDRDDNGQNSQEEVYERIKILTEEGRKYATLEIPYIKGEYSVRGIEARTVRPDGSVVKFTGEIYDQSIVKSDGIKINSKSVNLPDVEVGSIVEYRYRRSYQPYYVFDSHWILSGELFTRYAKFSLLPFPRYGVRYAWPAGLPEGSTPPTIDKFRKIRMEVHDVPAFVTEDYMPPAEDLEMRVDFVYLTNSSDEPEKDPEVFWQRHFKKAFKALDKFLDEPKAMKKALEQIVVPNDSLEERISKIYARVQRMRNLSFEREMDEEELKHQGIHALDSVKDVWNSGYGDRSELNSLFLALARAAGAEAYPVLISKRDRHIFAKQLQNPHDIDGYVVELTVAGKAMFVDPGCKFAPLGELPWYETGVVGRRLDREGGAWDRTPIFDSKASGITRSARLQLDAQGLLEGDVTAKYTGEMVLGWRISERDEDVTARKKFLETQLAHAIPGGAEVSLTNDPDWETSSTELLAEYHIRIPGWAAVAGQRALFPVTVFGGEERPLFTHASRIHPLYFTFPFFEKDDVAVTLPLQWGTASIPKVAPIEERAFAYSVSGDESGGVLHLARFARYDFIVVPVAAYGTVQSWFDGIRTGDEEQVLTLMNDKAKH
jgi:hypothetical protein